MTAEEVHTVQESFLSHYVYTIVWVICFFFFEKQNFGNYFKFFRKPPRNSLF